MRTEKDVENDFLKLQVEIKNKRNSEFFAFIKQLLLLSTTLLGLVVAFHKFGETQGNHTFLILSISLFSLNILLALIVLHGQIRNLDKSVLSLEEARKQQKDEKQSTDKRIFVLYDIGVVYGARTLYVSFFLSVLFLCLYGTSSLQHNKTQITITECPKR
jgi:hypothetical protein